MPGGVGSACAAGAGLLGALAACSAKLALGADYLRAACVALVAGEESATGLCLWFALTNLSNPIPLINLVHFLFLLSYENVKKYRNTVPWDLYSIHSIILPMMLRVGCGSLVLACNAIMWTLFAKALRYSSSSATATVTSTASNFISSAFLGKLLFGETHALLWWIGISITLLGLLLLHTGTHLPEEQNHPKEKTK